jgi:asparagine synthase (glutamine-hydrolysing)
MGSIAAFFTPISDHDAVRRMLLVAPHRGSCLETRGLGQCVLGISNADGDRDASLAHGGGYAVAFVGVLDNGPELAAELELLTSQPATAAEIVLAAFRELGDAMPNRLRGAFGAVITNGSRLWCLRDHVGFGTLFYRHDGHRFYAATEAKQVVAGAGLSRQPDLEVVERIFFGDIDDETPTAIKGARRLPKANILAFDGLRTTQRRYWDPEALLETSDLRQDELAERFEDLLRQAVRRSLTGEDVVSLSGGIDSPPLAAFGAPEHLKFGGKPLSALTAVYPNQPSVDESDYVRDIAGFLDIPLYTYERTAVPLERLEEWAGLFDGPVPRILYSDVEEHYGHVRRLGFKTMLTGEVAEFVFAMRGYTIAHLLLTGRFTALRHYLHEHRTVGTSTASVAKQLLAAPVPRSLAVLNERLHSKWGKRAPGWIDAGRVRKVAAGNVVPARDRWRNQQLLMLAGPGLSMEADNVVQSLYGVRTRRPWADIDLWEFFLGLPAEVKYTDGRRKALVRSLLWGRVPDVILERRDKTGFEESVMARVNYESLDRWLLKPRFELPGVDYKRLGQRLRQRDLTAGENNWAMDLAMTHAFVETA